MTGQPTPPTVVPPQKEPTFWSGLGLTIGFPFEGGRFETFVSEEGVQMGGWG